MFDECSRNLDNCHADADCINAEGSFTCQCKPGFEGSGVSCTGMQYTLYSLHFTYVPCFGILVMYHLRFKTTVGSVIHILMEMYINNISWESSLVLLLPTSWLLFTPTTVASRGQVAGSYTMTRVVTCDHSDALRYPDYLIYPKYKPRPWLHVSIYKTKFVSIIDINECVTGIGICHVNAECTNTRGNYNCECKPGYRGDGLACSGRIKCAVLTL